MTYKPTTIGAKTATLSVTVSAPAASKNVTLTGTGTAPVITASATTRAFGNQLINTVGSSQTVTVGNTGTAPLFITGIAVTGANLADFSKTSTCPIMGSGLALGKTCTISLKFKPTTIGVKKASLAINVSSPALSKTVTLTGTGTAPIANVSRATVLFGNQVKNTLSSAQTVTVSNSGTAPLFITGISITGTNLADFSKTTICPINGAGLAAGKSCTVSMRFKPTAIGAKTASLQLKVAIPALSRTVALSGTGR